MAYTDNSDENIACLCAFISTFAEEPKNQLKMLVQNMQTLVDAAEVTLKMVSMLVNFEDTLRLAGLQVLSQILDAAANPLKAPVAFLYAATKNFADCPPVANISVATKNLKDFFFSDIDDLQYQIKLYAEALNKADYELLNLQRVREVLEDLAGAIDSCNFEELKNQVK